MELLEEMTAREDVQENEISYNATISACAKGGQPEKALELFEELKARKDVREDYVSYGAVLQAVRHQRQIAEPILLDALQRGMLAKPRERTDAEWLFDLHDHSEGSAVTATRVWLEREVAPWHFGAGADDPTFVGLITGYGKSRESWQQTDVKAAVTQLLVWEGTLS